MRFRCCLVFVSLVLVGFAPAPLPRRERRDTDSRPDLQRLQGTWDVLERQRGGVRQPPEKAEVRVTGTRWTFAYASGAGSTWEIHLDPTKTPRRITLALNHTHSLLGIYRLDGDTLIVCYCQPNDHTDRPRRFDEGGGCWLITLRRARR